MQVAIIGAGPAGATAAYELKKQGKEVIVFEKDAVLGGRTQTYRSDTIQYDTGAGFFTNFYPTLQAYIEKLGLDRNVIPLERSVQLVAAQQVANYRFGSIASFWRLPFLNMFDKFKMMRHTAHLTLNRQHYDLADIEKLAQHDKYSIAEYSRKFMNEKIYQYCIRPGVEPFWYFSCEQVSSAMVTALQSRAADAKFFTFSNGMDVVCQSLLKDIQIFYNAPIEDIEITPQQKVAITLEQYNQRLLFDAVVLACPADAAWRIVQFLPPRHVTDFQRQFIREQQYASNIHATFMVNAADVKKIPAYLYPCGNFSPDVAAIVLHRKKHPQSAIIPADKELISIYLSHQGSQAILYLAEEMSYQKIWQLGRQFCPDLPALADPIFMAKRPNAIPLHKVGRFVKAAAFQEVQRAPIVFAGDYLNIATVEGAIRTGIRAAEILR